jgi:hypothetical protein
MEIQTIQSKIYEFRGYKVMLDFDLATLYQTETKVLKQAVRRNISRFPKDFLFVLTRKEYRFLRSQNVTLETGRGQYSKYLPFAFTEQGVAMLSSVLNSPKAIKVNIAIVRAFVLIRQLAISNTEIREKLNRLEAVYNKKFKDINSALAYLMREDAIKVAHEKRRRIGFKTNGKKK